MNSLKELFSPPANSQSECISGYRLGRRHITLVGDQLMCGITHSAQKQLQLEMYCEQEE